MSWSAESVRRLREQSRTVPRVAFASKLAEITAADLSGLTTDAVDLRRAADRVFAQLQANSPQQAASTLRAWASMALTMVGRIEWSLSYQQGVADAVAKLSEPIEYVPERAERRPGAKPGRRAVKRDCGRYGLLTLAEMASTAGCTEAAVRQRMRVGWSAEQAIAAGPVMVRGLTRSPGPTASGCGGTARHGD